jgi:hypothetical protein
MNFEDWVDERWNGPVQIKSREWLIAALGLGGESAEVLGGLLDMLLATGRASEHLKKHYRDGKHPGEALKLELGDALHYLVVLAHSYGWSLRDLMHANMKKLEARDARRAADGEEVRP